MDFFLLKKYKLSNMPSINVVKQVPNGLLDTNLDIHTYQINLDVFEKLRKHSGFISKCFILLLSMKQITLPESLS